MKMNEDGFSLVESMAVSAGMALLITALMASFYLSYSKMMLQHVGYRSLICVASNHPKKLCKRMAKKKLKLYLPIGTLQAYKTSRWRGRYRINMKWKVFAHKSVSYRKKLKVSDGY